MQCQMFNEYLHYLLNKDGGLIPDMNKIFPTIVERWLLPEH